MDADLGVMTVWRQSRLNASPCMAENPN